jgi:hypothetical protein
MTGNAAGYTSAERYAGAHSARFGLLPSEGSTVVTGVRETNLIGDVAVDGDVYSSGYQMISIPYNAVGGTFSFRWKPFTEDPANDFQCAMLLDTNYYVLATLMTARDNSGEWKQETFDLTPYKGRSVVIYCETYNNDANSLEGRTWMFLDDVSAVSCLPPANTNVQGRIQPPDVGTEVK